MIYKIVVDGFIDGQYNDETSELKIGDCICVSGVPKDSVDEAATALLKLSNTYGNIVGEYNEVMAHAN